MVITASSASSYYLLHLGMVFFSLAHTGGQVFTKATPVGMCSGSVRLPAPLGHISTVFLAQFTYVISRM